MQKQSQIEYRVKFEPFTVLENPNKLPFHISSFSLPSGIDELHYHDGIELGFCSEGSGVFMIGTEVICFQAPCVSIIYPQQFHKAKNTSEQDCKWDFISFSPEVPITHLNLFSPILQGSKASQSIFSDDTILFSLIKELVYELKHQETHFLDCVSGLLKSILVKHSRLIQQNDASFDASTFVRIGPILNYISNNYKKEITIQELSAIFHISSATLRRWFRDCLKLSPIEYLHKIRTTTATSLLLNTNLSILDISLEVGYQSQSSFQRQFQKHYHSTPTEYKAKNRK